MATIQNERDILLQATSPRLLSNPANYISLVPTTNTITNNAGVYSPSSVTIVANLNGSLRGTVSWSLSPSVTYSTSGNSITITSSNISAGASITVTASLSFNGGNYTATTVITKKEAVSLSSSGVLSGEGGGTITNLPYSSTTGGPPTNATANYFTSGTTNPTGGNNGDAYWNTTTSTMWFKIGGVWQIGGTINADSITVGTLAAARIAADSITANHIAPSTITASEIAANTITASKLTITQLSDITSNLGSPTSGSIGSAVNINGTPASTVTTNASNGYTAFQDTVDFRVPGAPTNVPVISTITTSSSAVGTVDIKLTWTYTQGAIKADHFIIYYLEGTTNPTTSSPILGMVTGDSRDLTISGVPMDKNYKFGIVAARSSSLGVQKTAIVNAWTRTAATANITANIDGTSPSGVKNTNITLSSSGQLIGAGGGSITALPYSNVTGGPPANATANFFSTSISNPTGGSDGDAHYNSSTNVMWFKVAGVWQQGGTINAGSITVGTLAAARIATNSITSDKLSVSSLSAISANLGTVTAGSITGSSSLSIGGSATFTGSTTDGSSFYTIVANAAGISFGGGIKGNAGSSGVGVYGDTSTTGDRGVAGVSRLVGSRGVQATNTASSSGWALDITSGYMTINNTTLVSNLNADMVDGLHASKFVRTDTNSTVTGNIDITGTLQTDFFRIDQTPGTGIGVADFPGNNKPGGNTTCKWANLSLNGTTYYFPVWT